MFVTKVRNQLKEFGFTYRKAKQKPSLTHKQKKVKLMWDKEKQPWMKVIFNDESKICSGKKKMDDHLSGGFSNKNDYQKKTGKFPMSCIIQGCRTFKRTKR